MHTWTSWWASASSTSDSCDWCAAHWTSMLLMPSFAPLSIVFGLLQQCVGWTVSKHVQATSVCFECGCSARLSVTWLSECVNPDDRAVTPARISTSSRTSCASCSTRVCMDRHPTTCPDDVFEFATFLAVHISGLLQLDSSWCQLRTKNDWIQRVLILWPSAWHGTISPYICGMMTAPHH